MLIYRFLLDDITYAAQVSHIFLLFSEPAVACTNGFDAIARHMLDIVPSTSDNQYTI